MRLSKIFNIDKSQYELDFIDIDPTEDIPLFIDPYFISRVNSPFANNLNRTIYSFFKTILNFLRSGEYRRAKELFYHLGEPNETCLGFSESNPKGRGVGSTDADKIFESLLKSRAIKTGVVEDIEDVRIFVPGIDKDKLSDLTTNIIRGHLIDYTQNQCKLWGIPLVDNVPSGFYWNRKNSRWENKYTKMLIVNDKKILLVVPKNIVSYSKEYTPQKYIQHFVLNFLQNEQLRLNSSLVKTRKNGEKYVTKKSIRENMNHLDKEFLIDFTIKHPEVFEKFKRNTYIRNDKIVNSELTNELLADIISHLIKKLKNTEYGTNDATKYHRTITGILELLFYPDLTSPQVEQEIHQGRKRIDITFDNCSERGFFYRVSNTYGIPCQFIFVECKNYTRDVKNPELDQISGRFSPNRGKCGLLLCRKIDNMERFIDRCSDTYKDDRGLVIPIVDTDIIEMLYNYALKGKSVWEIILQERFRKIALK